ncbi:hypothetical protein [uncultured phage]|nr:hypothetical protein [uncultured phage]
MSNQISELNRSDNLTPSRDTRFFISGVYGFGEDPPTREADLAAAIVLGDTTLTVATGGFGRILYPGTLIYLGATSNDYVVVRTKTTATQTAIQIEPAKVAASLATPAQKCTLKSWVPLISAKTFNVDTSTTEVSDSVFTEIAVEKFISEIMSTGSVSGAIVFGDPGYEIVKAAEQKGARIYLEIIYMGQRGGLGFQTNVSQNVSGEKGNFLQGNITLTISGNVIDIKPMATSPFSPNVADDLN